MIAQDRLAVSCACLVVSTVFSAWCVFHDRDVASGLIFVLVAVWYAVNSYLIWQRLPRRVS